MFNRDTGRRRRDPRCSQSVMVASLSIAAVPASSASDPAPPTADDVVEAASLSAASLMEATVLATLLSTIWRGLDATLYFLV